MTFSISHVGFSGYCGRSDFQKHKGSKTALQHCHNLGGLKPLIDRY